MPSQTRSKNANTHPGMPDTSGRRSSAMVAAAAQELDEKKKKNASDKATQDKEVADLEALMVAKQIEVKSTAVKPQVDKRKKIPNKKEPKILKTAVTKPKKLTKREKAAISKREKEQALVCLTCFRVNVVRAKKKYTVAAQQFRSRGR